MSDAPYFKPHEQGPIFPDDDVVGDVETFLAATNRDVEDDVARQNRADIAESSFNEFVAGIVQEKLVQLKDERDKANNPNDQV